MSEIQNYLNFIKVGNFSKVVTDALGEAEKKSKILKDEVQSLEFQMKKVFKVPPKEWIDHRLENLHETLQKNTTSSALALKELLGTIYMEGITGECRIENENLIQEKPYYVAHSKIQTLALLNDGTKGSNWLQMRKR